MNQTEKLIIAIDGPAGAGKSTVAKLIAKRYSLLYIDSGAMYRAVAWKALQKHVDITDEQEVARIAADMHIDLLPSDEGTLVIADGQDITGVIREPVITDISSKIATFASLREILVSRQQRIGQTRGVVMEGRDIGSIVFPNAPLKFYLDASIRERAIRRKRDLEQAGHRLELADLEQQIRERDQRDMMREIGPLKKADDAIVIDTSALSIQEVVENISTHVDEFLQGAVKK